MARLLKYFVVLLLLVSMTYAVIIFNRSPVVVGFAGPLTGPYSDLGVNGRNGARLAVEEINDRGGIDGRKMELLVRNDKGLCDEAAQATAELIDSGAQAIIGHMTSQQTISALPVAAEKGVVLLSPTTSTPKLSGIKDNFFRIQPSTDQHAIALARYVFHEKEIDTLCTLRDMDNEIYADSFEKHFVQEFKSAGGEVTNRKKLYASRSQDWLQIADDLQLCSEQGLFLAVSGRDAVNLVQAIDNTGLSPDIFSSGWAMTRELLRAGGRTVENMTFVTTTSQENLGTDYYEFAKNYRSRFGSEPSFAAAMAYDAAHILALALEESSGDRGLEQALTEIRDYPGLYWPITIDEYGDVTSPVTIVQVREGEFEEVYSFKAEDFE